MTANDKTMLKVKGKYFKIRIKYFIRPNKFNFGQENTFLMTFVFKKCIEVYVS